MEIFTVVYALDGDSGVEAAWADTFVYKWRGTSGRAQVGSRKNDVVGQQATLRHHTGPSS